MRLRSAILLVAALALLACGRRDSPVTAARVMEVSGLQAVVNAVALTPDGSLVVVGDLDGELIARRVPSGTERWKRQVHPRGAARRIDGIFPSPDSALLVTTGYDARGVEIWDAASGKQVASFDIGDSRMAAFHPTESTLVVGAGGSLYVIDLARAVIVRTLEQAHAGDRVYAVAFSGDGQTLATASHQGSLKVWNWPALTLLTSVAMSSSPEAMAPVSLALSRRGTRAAANGLGGTVQVIDIATGTIERTFANSPEEPSRHAPHAELRYSLAFTHDGDWVFAPDLYDRGVRILHLPTRKAWTVLRGQGPFYKAIALAMPARMVALLRPADGQGRGPYALDVWELKFLSE